MSSKWKLRLFNYFCETFNWRLITNDINALYWLFKDVDILKFCIYGIKIDIKFINGFMI